MKRNPEFLFAVSNDGGSPVNSSAEEREIKRSERRVLAVEDMQLQQLIADIDFPASVERIFELSQTSLQDARDSVHRSARLLAQAARDAYAVHQNEELAGMFLGELNSQFIRKKLGKREAILSFRSAFILLAAKQKYRNDDESRVLTELFDQVVKEEVASSSGPYLLDEEARLATKKAPKEKPAELVFKKTSQAEVKKNKGSRKFPWDRYFERRNS